MSIATWCEAIRGRSTNAAVALVIRQALSSADVYFPAPLLAETAVQRLRDDPAHALAVELIEVLAYGTVAEILEQGTSASQWSNAARAEVLANPTLLRKLRIVSIVGECAGAGSVPLRTLCTAAGLNDTRDLEVLLVECITDELIAGRIDHLGGRLVVDEAVGRDMRDPTRHVDDMLQRLMKLQSRCAAQIEQLNRAALLESSLNQQRRDDVDRLTSHAETMHAMVRVIEEMSVQNRQWGYGDYGRFMSQNADDDLYP